ncbi:MAG TPA: hypothetical protein VG738_15025 [Chitinophagaceae bacterium]|nr:hypothetical protein [Chitinophagaceae bacterium]
MFLMSLLIVMELEMLYFSVALNDDIEKPDRLKLLMGKSIINKGYFVDKKMQTALLLDLDNYIKQVTNPSPKTIIYPPKDH